MTKDIVYVPFGTPLSKWFELSRSALMHSDMSVLFSRSENAAKVKLGDSVDPCKVARMLKLDS